MNPASLGRRDPWDGVRAVVAGFGVSGQAAADNLLFLGAAVTAHHVHCDPWSLKAPGARRFGGHVSDALYASVETISRPL